MAQDESKKVQITLNGKSVSVEPGTSVIQAALGAGEFVPHYCYHPDLSVAGVCRMCVVEIEKNPRLQISCNTACTEGMVVRTDTEKVKAAVQSALELHLINHPLDCPICDKAGECKLQDYYVDYGLYESRMEFEKVHKRKVVDIGPIVLDQERCILCTRCVRFTSEVTETSELGIFNRGDRSELNTYNHGPLQNEYTGNLADICPVGALTAKDFRFQQRVWFLNKTPSVCASCAHGCNTVVSVNPTTDSLYRVEPRRNVEVNKSWMCDEGRWNYHYVTNDSRIKVPYQLFDGKRNDAPWHAFFKALHAEIESNAESVLVGLSTHLTNEELTDAVNTLNALGITRFLRVVDEAVVEDRQPYDGLLKHRDLTPNALGFEKTMGSLTQNWLKLDEAKALLQKGGITRVMVFGMEGEHFPGLAPLVQSLPASAKLSVHSTNWSPLFERCDWVIPNTSSFEKSGTLVNALGKMQKLNAAMAPKFISRDLHAVLFGLARGNDRETMPESRAFDVFEKHVMNRMLAKDTLFNWENRYDTKGDVG